jgi:hypothetical protein
MRTLFRVLGTPYKADAGLLVNLAALWGLMSWLAGRRRPERSWSAQLGVGALSAAGLLTPDLAHTFGHVVSARRAGAPVDEVVFSDWMPQTLYADNDVSPDAHRARATGGPVMSGVAFSISLLLRSLSPRGSLGRELMDGICVGHGFIFFGSLLPLPMVDGGTLLKWTLVERGRTPAEADEVVRQVDVGLGTAAVATGVVLALRSEWWPALGCLAGGAVALWSALRRRR